MSASRCPCGSGIGLARCCGRLHAEPGAGATAEQVMRSRYTAHVLGLAGHLLVTWHPSTRPASVGLDPSVEWLGLEVRATTGGGMLDAAATVDFVARHRRGDGPVELLAERSRFERVDGRWAYVGPA